MRKTVGRGVPTENLLEKEFFLPRTTAQGQSPWRASNPPTIRLFEFVPQLSCCGARVVGGEVGGCVGGWVGGWVGGRVVGREVVGAWVGGFWLRSSQQRVKSKLRKPQGERIAWVRGERRDRRLRKVTG